MNCEWMCKRCVKHFLKLFLAFHLCCEILHLTKYRYDYKVMGQIRMCKDLKHLIYYRFSTVSKKCMTKL